MPDKRLKILTVYKAFVNQLRQEKAVYNADIICCAVIFVVGSVIDDKIVALFYLGEFGVKTCGAVSTIISDTDKICFSTLTAQGMPFYGGNIIYNTEIDVPDCTAIVRANFYLGALIKVFMDGKDMGIIAFSPYKLKLDGISRGKHTVEFELFGTRINTFGGMHNVSQSKWVCPVFWRSTGDNRCYEYNLKNTGILASPIIEIYED